MNGGIPRQTVQNQQANSIGSEPQPLIERVLTQELDRENCLALLPFFVCLSVVSQKTVTTTTLSTVVGTEFRRVQLQ